jgi:outer membrane immunogenic protein
MKHSKRFAAAAAASAMFGIGAASAADLPLKAPPPVAPVFSWTGFYVGGDVGGAWARTDASTIQFAPGATPADLQLFRLSGSSVLAGLHAGYNWQVAPTWLLGVEGDADWTGIKASTTGPLLFNGVPNAGVPFITTTDTLSRNVNWLASIRGRAGYIGGSWLLYATGGAAWGGLQQSATQTLSAPGVSAIWPFSSSTTAAGWVAGAGVEYALNRNWILRGEYLYYSLKGTTGGTTPFINGVPATGGAGGFFSDTFGRTTVQTVRAGISYKFGGPVVAKY